jgi:hypothetical protein
MSGRDVFEKMSVRGKKDGEERISSIRFLETDELKADLVHVSLFV